MNKQEQFLSGAGFVITFQRSIIRKIAASKFDDEIRNNEIKAIVDELVALVETSWIAAKDAAKEEKDGTHN